MTWFWGSYSSHVVVVLLPAILCVKTRHYKRVVSKIIALCRPVSYFSDDVLRIYLGNGMGSIAKLSTDMSLEGEQASHQVSTQQSNAYRQ